MQNIYFDDYSDLACDIADKFDMVKENFEDIAVIAKPDDVKEIFKELVCIGYDICNITYERIDWDGYDDEYILSMNHDGIWLEKFKREDGKYLIDESTITYILDNCSSKVIPYCKGKIVYEVSIGDECDCAECCGCCECDNDKNTECTVKSDDDGYSITVRCNLDADEAMEMIKDMENRMERMNDMFREMDSFRKLLRF